MTVSPDTFGTNDFLAALSADDRERLRPRLRESDLAPGTILQHAGEDVTSTWFPCGAAMASFCVEEMDGRTVDVAAVGREGAIGGIVSHGSLPSFSTATVRFGGTFLHMPIVELEQAQEQSPHLRYWFARYSDCLLAQIFQNCACNATHNVGQRAARWLLAGIDRTGSTDLRMTQEQLADMLGVGRPFVNRVISTLRAEGIVATARGHIRILDRSALEKRTCACTNLTRQHFSTVFGALYTS
ncbi:cAMP-binding protein [Ameyamaea chiangmaiensis NBRC 103196]|uniref:Crp/Fnr family transcriptional regulator n=1 Tax=Ameyamaea chiangmaiensis TaxID=442969 RepID=A0A850P9K8_9PROT|nr:Crp/Fnr family transcriptional regulator [Ameyamaea chiangmaiensis]MBS4075183.1 Crp/Fnr family transcriptional regulator [Ameyamaea chiangmaiensis]NVN41285.1 Crp/Fnr family transcriptional regulator [Ameyamaea chiangmaiensis]GBQ66337.1 cAMP-binding protein [Ameyamaea chiangmaiensis NBRC 103196]